MVAAVKECAAMLAQSEGITKAEAERRIKSVVEVIASQCIENGGVSFKGVFTIETKTRSARHGKCAGREYDSPAKKYLTIRTGSGLSAELNPDQSM